MDNRQQIKPGDFFNITEKPNGNETWDNQNRFETCQLKEIKPTGEWAFVEYWYEYSTGDYPFLSSTITWNVYNTPAMECLFERIEDPETQGFKDKKRFLPELIAKRIEKLKKEHNSISRRIILSAIAKKQVGEDMADYMTKLNEVSERLALNFYKQDNDYIDALMSGETYPFVSVIKNGKVETGTVSRLFPDSGEIELNVCDDYHVFSLSEIVPNPKLWPIDFAIVHPFSSVFQNCECESLAARILYFTDDWDKPLAWEQYYETMTVADKGYSSAIKKDFDRLQPFLKNPDTCATFSGAWLSVVNMHTAKQ